LKNEEIGGATSSEAHAGLVRNLASGVDLMERLDALDKELEKLYP
jgi:hypothetical protein